MFFLYLVEIKKFPKIPDAFYKYGAIHENCGHNFSPYIDGVNDPQLEYTLQIHKLQNPAYGKDIVAYSNRPFVDDRIPEEIERANEYIQKQKTEKSMLLTEDELEQRDIQHGKDWLDYVWVRNNLPKICPKTITGYRRMKTMLTKNFQKICVEAKKLGKDLMN